MASNKVIVTGGAGYIGSHTCIELIQAGYDVIVVDNLSNSDEKSLDRIEKIAGSRPTFYNTDVTDAAALSQIFAKEGEVAGIIHFAAKKAVGESVEKPLLYYKVNLGGLTNVLQQMTDHQIAHLIFSSSCTVYGEATELPVTEDSPILPAASPYGNTKQIGEEIIRDYAVARDGAVKAVALRYFNPVGAHASGLIGELPLGVPSNLMPYITQTAAGLRDRLSVFGSDYDTPDGTAIRDYIHVVDLAKAHVAALESLIDERQKDSYEVYNLGTGRGSTVLEVIQSFERVSGLKLSHQIVGRRPGDVEAIYGATARANQKLGWKAELTLDDMTRSAWLWEKNLRGIN